MVVAFVALSVALGGTSYAVAQLPKKSVGTKQLKRNAVTRANIKKNAVNSSKVAKESLTGSDINESSLGQVPSAAAAGSAASAGTANHATASTMLDRIAYRTVEATVGPATPDPDDPAGDPVTRVAGATATCDAGQLATGGGAKVDDLENTAVIDSYPDAGGRSWSARVGNDDAAAAHTFWVYVVCIPAGAAG
ncbi:MAG: hypothetical protein ACRDPC_02325 [Solirubrobacteraceae bacterium]